MGGKKVNSRYSVLGKTMAEAAHDGMDLGPVVTSALAFLVAQDDGEAEVALGVGIPLLLSGRHLDESKVLVERERGM
jgi:hypothetical protein